MKKTKKQIFLDTVTNPNFSPYTIINDNVVWNEPYRFTDQERSYRPQCINAGCYNRVAIFRGTVGILKGREIRTVCSSCHTYC